MSADLSELAGIVDVAVHGNVTIRGKIVSVNPVEDIKSKNGDKRFWKQECMIADKGCVCRFVLWEESVETVENGKCYKVMNVAVKMYNGSKYFSTTDSSVICEVEDIGSVAEG